MDQLVLKPNRTVAVTLQQVISISVSLIFSVGFIAASTFMPDEFGFIGSIMFGIGVLLLLNVVFIVWVTKVRYEKTNYRFEKSRIITTSGGPFSDSSTELEIRNVTHVKLVLPWIEHLVFRTGAVHVESAGTGGIEAHLIHLDEPEQVYGRIQGLLRENGFALSSEKNLMDTRASRVGAAIDVATGIVTAFFALLWVGGIILIPAIIASLWLLLFTIPIFAIVAFGFYAYYRNSISKTYTITEDGIYYDEGFLTRRKAVIPVENLSNSHINEPFLKRIFGVSDVLVSCQGSASEIAFRNLPDAKRFDQSISELINTDTPAQPVQSEQAEHRGEVRAAARKRAERLKRSTMTGTTTYRPSMRPAFIGAGAIIGIVLVLAILAGSLAIAFSIPGAIMAIPLVFGVSVLLAAGGLVLALINVAITTYTLEANRVKSEVSLFNRVEHAFNDDRLTRITVTRTLFDRIARTVNVEFWSIGSGERIRFSSVQEESGLIDAIHEKYGLREPTDHLIRSEPTIATIMRANTYGVITTIVFIAVSALISIFWYPAILITSSIAFFVWALIIILSQLAYRNAFFAVDEKSLYEVHGWLVRSESYVSVEDIKGVTTTQYPLGTQATIEFNVAGEGIVKTDKGEHIIPNAITIPFISEGFEHAEALSISLDEFAPPSKPRRIANVSAARVAVPILLIGIIVPLLPIAVIAAVITAIRAGKMRFFIEDHRIVREIRFIYPTRKVIFYDRIDHLNTNQGFFDKLFGTGTVQVTTTGSSRIEMNVGPTKDHAAVHEALDAAYR